MASIREQAQIPKTCLPRTRPCTDIQTEEPCGSNAAILLCRRSNRISHMGGVLWSTSAIQIKFKGATLMSSKRSVVIFRDHNLPLLLSSFPVHVVPRFPDNLCPSPRVHDISVQSIYVSTVEPRRCRNIALLPPMDELRSLGRAQTNAHEEATQRWECQAQPNGNALMAILTWSLDRSGASGDTYPLLVISAPVHAQRMATRPGQKSGMST